MTYFAWPWLVGGVLRLLRLLRETRALSKKCCSGDCNPVAKKGKPSSPGLVGGIRNDVSNLHVPQMEKASGKGTNILVFCPQPGLHGGDMLRL